MHNCTTVTVEPAPQLIEPISSEQPQAADPSTGQTSVKLGRYELLGEIASGGMATVYLGRSLGAGGFQRLVAIKRMHPHIERDEEFVASFLEEARLAARIRHPNVVATLDVEDGEAPFLVMEYIEGDRLSGLIKEHVNRQRAGLPLQVALRVAIDSLDGLHAAHELHDDDGVALDLIHRDISPQNVLVGVDGVSRVTDFGIAKAIGRASHTREGELKGKIAYMSPEQLTNPTAIDRRVDVFAMGIIVWEMLTGRRLFRAATDMETIGVVLHADIPLIRPLAPTVPERVEAIVMRALARDPSQRWATAQDFARALDSIGLAAPQRVVADFVKATVGEKLERERARLRSGWVVNTPTGSVSGGSRSRELPVSEVRRTGSLLLTHPQPKTKPWLLLAVTAVGCVLVGTVGALAYRLSHRPSEPIVRVIANNSNGISTTTLPVQTPTQVPTNGAINGGVPAVSDQQNTAQNSGQIAAQDAGVVADNNARRVRNTGRIPGRNTGRNTVRTHHVDEPDNGCNPYVQRCPNQ